MAPATKWQEWTSFLLGLWLACSPWLLGYSEHEAATANAAFLGLTLALGAHFEVSLDTVAAEWLNLLAGLWLIAAPFLLGFTAASEAAASSVAVGTLIVVLAASAMSLDKELGKLWNKVAHL
jgi:hypothetical protein